MSAVAAFGFLASALEIMEPDPASDLGLQLEVAFNQCSAELYPKPQTLPSATFVVTVPNLPPRPPKRLAALNIVLADPKKADSPSQLKFASCLKQTFSLQPHVERVLAGRSYTVNAPVSAAIFDDGDLGTKAAQNYLHYTALALAQSCERKRWRVTAVVSPSGSVDLIDDSTATECLAKKLRTVLKFPASNSALMIDTSIVVP